MTLEEAINILNRDDDSMRKGYFCINDFLAIEVLKPEESILDKIIKSKIVKRYRLDFEDRERDRNDAFLEVLDIIDKYREGE